MENLQTTPETPSFDVNTFEHTQRVAKMICSSSLIPKEYQNNIQNTMIAMEMANRLGVSPMLVMQNLHIIHGRPSWSSSFIIASLNSCGKFSELRFEITGNEGTDDYGCSAWAYDLNKDKIVGPKITMRMAKAEGWIDKSGSKWKTMPELMLRYRAAAFFGRLFAPNIMMGMHTQEEIIDITNTEVTADSLKLLLDDKIAELNKSEFDFAKRVIETNETQSFKKLHSLLTSKNNGDNK